VTDYLCANFPDIMNYDFTATVEKDFDNIAEGARVWNEVISEFYYPFHERVVAAVEDRQFSKVERELGTDPADGSRIVAKFGQYGPFVQKGDGENKVCASLGRGQLIENITLEDALKLLKQPRTVGEYKGIPIVAMKGRYGPYIKYGDKNFSLPRGTTTDGISLDDCIALIEGNGNKADEQKPLKEWDGIMVMNGRYGPYIKAGGKNYKLPAGTDAASLTEEACRKIIAETQPVVRKFKRFNK
ncbi:MAG: DNA topoisomerase I, partial [Bacteroidales bacterium]|nr:DNA topoisomerase I [Bacteroidales bacterium]